MPIDVKICGLSTPDTMRAALDAGADYVGLVFYEPSPRYVALDLAARLAEMARGRAQIVALFVDPDDDLVDAVLTQVRPDVLQFHGSETPARLQEFRARTDARLLKAIKVHGRDDVVEADRYRDVVDMILFDAKAPPSATDALPGGNGEPFDWSVLEAYDRALPWMLGGGLDRDTVARAVQVTGATIVDVSSGVERAKGEKDVSLIAAFLAAAKHGGDSSAEHVTHGVPDRVEA